MEITITIGQLLAVCAGIATISSATVAIYKLLLFLHQPEKSQNERLQRLEERVDKHEEQLKEARKEIEVSSDATKMSQKALLALLAHGIDGNEIEGMRNAKHELEEFLINSQRGVR